MRISDWSSDVCSSDLCDARQSRPCTETARDRLCAGPPRQGDFSEELEAVRGLQHEGLGRPPDAALRQVGQARSEEHTSELQSLMRISYAVFCLKKKNNISRKNRLSQVHNNKTKPNNKQR